MFLQLGILKKGFLKSCESFLRKSQVSTLTDLNPGFRGLWDMLAIIFVNDINTQLSFKMWAIDSFQGTRIPGILKIP